jgi:hypothetical protein
VVIADDPCEAAFSGEDPTGPRIYYRARYYDPKVTLPPRDAAISTLASTNVSFTDPLASHLDAP